MITVYDSNGYVVGWGFFDDAGGDWYWPFDEPAPVVTYSRT